VVAIFRGITFIEHVPGSPIEILENDGARVTRMLDCDWTKSLSFADKLLGFPSIKTGTGNIKYVSRLTPAFHPDFLDAMGNPWIYATRITKLEGIGFRDKTTDDTAVYKTGRLTVVYESLTYEVKEDDEVQAAGVPDESRLLRYVTILFKPYAEFLTLPVGFMRWITADKQPVNFGLPLLIPTWQIDFIWHLIPKTNLPLAKIADAQGTINNAAFVTPLGTFPTGTLLLLNADLKPIRSALGDRLYDIHYHVKYKEPILGGGGDHNFFLRRKGTAPNETLSWELATANGLSTGDRLFKSTDFKLLFKPA
jgi:hypothetical protein